MQDKKRQLASTALGEEESELDAEELLGLLKK
jgi:hypothetical protein